MNWIILVSMVVLAVVFFSLSFKHYVKQTKSKVGYVL